MPIIAPENGVQLNDSDWNENQNEQPKHIKDKAASPEVALKIADSKHEPAMNTSSESESDAHLTDQ